MVESNPAQFSSSPNAPTNHILTVFPIRRGLLRSMSSVFPASWLPMEHSKNRAHHVGSVPVLFSLMKRVSPPLCTPRS